MRARASSRVKPICSAPDWVFKRDGSSRRAIPFPEDCASLSLLVAAVGSHALSREPELDSHRIVDP